MAEKAKSFINLISDTLCYGVRVLHSAVVAAGKVERDLRKVLHGDLIFDNKSPNSSSQARFALFNRLLGYRDLHLEAISQNT
eukprot:scaffold224081_cov17-Tisochrysis_lutea.AAC.1